MIFGGHRTVFALLVIASLVTDVFDGLIARRWHQETDLGTKLDSCTDLAPICPPWAGWRCLSDRSLSRTASRSA